MPTQLIIAIYLYNDEETLRGFVLKRSNLKLAPNSSEVEVYPISEAIKTIRHGDVPIELDVLDDTEYGLMRGMKIPKDSVFETSSLFHAPFPT